MMGERGVPVDHARSLDAGMPLQQRSRNDSASRSQFFQASHSKESEAVVATGSERKSPSGLRSSLQTLIGADLFVICFAGVLVSKHPITYWATKVSQSACDESPRLTGSLPKMRLVGAGFAAFREEPGTPNGHGNPGLTSRRNLLVASAWRMLRREPSLDPPALLGGPSA